MCWQCDNPDGDYTSHLIDLIDEHGWALSGVEATASDPGWLHTVGLPARFQHPELLIAGCSADAHEVLNGIAAYIRDSGRTIAAGEIMRLGQRVYTFGATSDERRRAGAIDASIDVHRVLGITDVDALEVMRVVEFEYCEHHFDEAIHELVAESP
jgi:xanthine dehydrogenase molybdopterin-binding subunit B